MHSYLDFGSITIKIFFYLECFAKILSETLRNEIIFNKLLILGK